MGKKRDKKRKHLLFYSACLLTILFSITGCAITSNLQKKPDGREYLVRSEALVAKGDYEGAIKENEEVLNLFPGVPPSDAALFQMGLIRINPGNPKRDYKGALDYFQRLVNDFPQSTLINEANAWISTISQLILNDGRIKELEKTMNDLSQQVFSLNDKAAKNEDRNKDLEETIRGLRRQITVSKEADMNMEEKNRELEETIKVLKKQINDMKEIDIKIEEKKRKDLSGQINHN
jgi:tetratricopeptide (TPR) repeat protein